MNLVWRGKGARDCHFKQVIENNQECSEARPAGAGKKPTKTGRQRQKILWLDNSEG